MEGRHLVVPLEPDVRFGAAANGQLGALIAKGDDPLGAGVVAVNQEGLAAPFGLDALLELSGRGEVGREGGSGHTGPRLRPLRARQAYARPGMVRPSLGFYPPRPRTRIVVPGSCSLTKEAEMPSLDTTSSVPIAARPVPRRRKGEERMTTEVPVQRLVARVQRMLARSDVERRR